MRSGERGADSNLTPCHASGVNVARWQRCAKLGRAYITKTSTTAKVIWTLMKKEVGAGAGSGGQRHFA
jgi:hypothetical protein